MQYVNTKVPGPKPYTHMEWGISSNSQRPPALTVTTASPHDAAHADLSTTPFPTAAGDTLMTEPDQIASLRTISSIASTALQINLKLQCPLSMTWPRSLSSRSCSVSLGSRHAGLSIFPACSVEALHGPLTPALTSAHSSLLLGGGKISFPAP